MKMNKKGFLDTEVLTEPMFWLLSAGSVAAVIIGWIASKRMGMDTFPLWNLILLLFVCVGASYFFAVRMSE